MNYESVFPQAGQNLSEAITGFPQFGQKPADFSLRPVRRNEIIASISSSVGATSLPEPFLRRAAMAGLMGASLSLFVFVCGSSLNFFRKSTRFFLKDLWCGG